MMTRKEIVWPQNLGFLCMIACICTVAYAIFGSQPLALILLVPLTAALCKFVQLDARMNREFMAEKHARISSSS
ncbi:Sodium/potassium/calcium exchanger 4 (plasmid) [Pseudomonas putida]|uniref:Sodium/potassium/calcium exchanger 4 n=1 Tax=Pseudomonas putida TaxID=303 RepID=A0A1L7NMX0_PSEPU|nr:hypothetical protein AO888_03220 [Pseudomonas aeruginosa]BAW26820.1 Sodium/potassium/calcium exchanger 4 [Pseudomonas putida]